MDGRIFLREGGKKTALNSLPQSSLSAWTGRCLKRDSPVCTHPLEAHILLSPKHNVAHKDIVGNVAMSFLARQRLPNKSASLSVPQAAHTAPHGAARWGETHGTNLGHSPTTMGRHRLQGGAWLYLKLKHPYVLLSVQTTVKDCLTASPLNVSGLGED